MDDATGVCMVPQMVQDQTLEIAAVGFIGVITILASATVCIRGSSLFHVWLLFILVNFLSMPLWILGSVLQIELLPGLPLSSLMFTVPALVACGLTWQKDGTASARAFMLSGVSGWQNVDRLSWHLASVGLMPLVLLGSYGFALAAELPLPKRELGFWEDLPWLFLIFFVAALCEEIAWSGFAFRPIQKQFGFLSASLLIGCFWAVWHFVPYVQAQGADNLTWVVGQSVFCLVFRILLAWLYEMTNRSVLDAALCHGSYNVAWQLFPNRGSGYNPWVAAGLAAVVLLTAVTVSPIPNSDQGEDTVGSEKESKTR